jgi:hypothetical protein
VAVSETESPKGAHENEKWRLYFMLDIEHLFESIITTMDTGGDLLALERHPVTQRMLNNATATFDEILAIAMYVRTNYCDGCRRMEGD